MNGTEQEMWNHDEGGNLDGVGLPLLYRYAEKSLSLRKRKRGMIMCALRIDDLSICVLPFKIMFVPGGVG